MEIIEKQIEKVKEIPADGYYTGYCRRDINGKAKEIMSNLMSTQPFTIKTSFIGDVEIGRGHIKLNIPLTDKRLVFNMTDLENFKEMLIAKD